MKFRRLTAVILAAALLISCATPVFAAEKASYTADCPYIFVHGFMGSDIYVDPDDPDSECYLGGRSFYNPNDSFSANHAVTIIGWDDNYSHAVEIIERLKPEKILLDHYDDTFPPLTGPLDLSPILQNYEGRIAPMELRRTYTI